MQAYCLRCKAKQEMVDPVEVRYPSGAVTMQGRCPVCGSKLSAFTRGAPRRR